MKNVKIKDIITLVVATAIIAVSVYFIWQFLFPKQKPKTSETDTKINTLSTEVDQNTLKKIDSLSDYGQPNLNNTGKSNLFAN